MQGDQAVQGSHIIDLLKCTLYPYKQFTPIGFDQFHAALEAINIPRSLITQTGRGLLPPPGLPITSKPDRPTKWVWHKM